MQRDARGQSPARRRARASAQKSVENLFRVDRRAAARSGSIGFIFALGIRHVGETTARDLAKAFGTLEALRAAIDAAAAARPGPHYRRMIGVPGLGPKTAETIMQHLGRQRVRGRGSVRRWAAQRIAAAIAGIKGVRGAAAAALERRVRGDRRVRRDGAQGRRGAAGRCLSRASPACRVSARWRRMRCSTSSPSSTIETAVDAISWRRSRSQPFEAVVAQVSPVTGKTVVFTGSLVTHHPQRGQGASRAARRQGRGLGIQEDGLCRRRGRCRLQARQGAGARRCRADARTSGLR